MTTILQRHRRTDRRTHGRLAVAIQRSAQRRAVERIDAENSGAENPRAATDEHYTTSTNSDAFNFDGSHWGVARRALINAVVRWSTAQQHAISTATAGRQEKQLFGVLVSSSSSQYSALLSHGNILRSCAVIRIAGIPRYSRVWR